MQEGHFIRVIKRREVLTLSFGAMIGWSWVALTGGWIDEAGSLGAMLAFVIGGSSWASPMPSWRRRCRRQAASTFTLIAR